ncbi:MAG: ceramidase domain-containing protein, partial [Rhodobacterales bacterium]|nr:ceramidase domain-containing protein [Rhodobacterales bacterium]
MDWFTPIDLYCERTAVGFWNEPLNALSNLAFPLAALIGWRTATKRGTLSRAITVLIALAALIGVGSFLFHTFANSWSELADVIPIWSFVALYIFVAIHKIGGVAPGRLVKIALVVAATLTVVFLATTGDTPDSLAQDAIPTPDLLNGSGQYAPALIALFVFAFISARRHHPM